MKHVGDTYVLIRKEDLSAQIITAKNDMDAETQSQLLIKSAAMLSSALSGEMAGR